MSCPWLPCLRRAWTGLRLLGLWLSLATWALAQDKEPNPDLTLRIRGPEEELLVGGQFEAVVLLDARVGGIEGFQFAVEHDPAALELLEARIGQATRTANGGRPPDVLSLNATPKGGAGVILGALIDIDQAETLDVGNNQELLRLRYRILADPSARNPCVPLALALRFSDRLATPSDAIVKPRVSIGAVSHLPILSEGGVTVRCPGSIEIVRCEGGLDDVQLEWDFSQSPPPWDFLFLYRDGELLQNLPADAKSYHDTNVAPGFHGYTLVTFIVEGEGDPQLVFTKCRTVVDPVTLTGIQPAIGNWVGGETVEVSGTAFTVPASRQLSFVGSTGEPTEGLSLPLDIVEVRSDTLIVARTTEASLLGLYDLTIETEFGVKTLPRAFSFGFLRGDANANGRLEIADVMAIYQYLFLGTAPRPRCRDAADVNDDGAHDVTDPLMLLFFLFANAIDFKPPAPHPAPGPDPTEDAFGCVEEEGRRLDVQFLPFTD